MKTYTVKEIADLVDTNPETVRRWIRSGKLCADQLSRKEGNVVHEEDLYKFLRSTSKYSAIAEWKCFASSKRDRCWCGIISRGIVSG